MDKNLSPEDLVKQGRNDELKTMLRSTEPSKLIDELDSEGRSAMAILMSKLKNLPEDVVACIVKNYKKSNFDREKKAKILVEAVGCTLQFVLLLGDDLTTALFLEKNNEITSREFRDAVEIAVKQQEAVTIQMLLEYMHRENTKVNELLCSERDCNDKSVFTMAWVEERLIQHAETLIMMGNEVVVQKTLDSNIDVYIRSKFGIEILNYLFYNQNVAAIDLLRKRSFDVNGKTSNGKSAIGMLVGENSDENARFLLDMGADPDTPSDEGTTFLYESVIGGKKSRGEILLQYGADIQLVPQLDRMFERCSGFRGTAVAQLVIDEARGVPIAKRFRDVIEFYSYDKILEKLRKQIEELKKYDLSNNLTLFCILTAKPEEIARRLRGKHWLSILEDYCKKHKIHTFYNSTLKFKLLRASTIYFAKCYVAKMVSQRTGISIDSDHLVVEKIFSFLTQYDMLQIT